jgi:hypothetical protein
MSVNSLGLTVRTIETNQGLNCEGRDSQIAKPCWIAFAFLGCLDDLLCDEFSDGIVSIHQPQGRERFVEGFSHCLNMLRSESRVLQETIIGMLRLLAYRRNATGLAWSR